MFIITGFVKRISSCERELNAICIYAKYILQRLPEKLFSLSITISQLRPH